MKKKNKYLRGFDIQCNRRQVARTELQRYCFTEKQYRVLVGRTSRTNSSVGGRFSVPMETLELKNVRDEHGRCLAGHVWVKTDDVDEVALAAMKSGETVDIIATAYHYEPPYSGGKKIRVGGLKYSLTDIRLA